MHQHLEHTRRLLLPPSAHLHLGLGKAAGELIRLRRLQQVLRLPLQAVLQRADTTAPQHQLLTVVRLKLQQPVDLDIRTMIKHYVGILVMAF